MGENHSLVQYLERSALLYPNRLALEEPPHGALTYRDLDRLADRVRDRLQHLGVQAGDRVGISTRKSMDAVAVIFGILKCGAAYVPVDAAAPPERNAYILVNCTVSVVVVEGKARDPLRAELQLLGHTPVLLTLNADDDRSPLAEVLAVEDERDLAPAGATIIPSEDAAAYLLYTSGSTGRPKGVVLSHRNAVSFVEWCSEAFTPTEADRFSSHAPFHFDLSVLDIFLSVKHGATLILIGEEIGKDPRRLAELISGRRISVWYSTPSVLSLLAQYGELERYDYAALRAVLFAGEVFPMKHLRRLKSLLSAPRYFNLFGPTETNVCTWYEIPDRIPDDRTDPFPIGKACSHLLTRVVGKNGKPVTAGEEGELIVSGPAVMEGYWQLPDQNDSVFLTDSSGRQWYRTGDIVVENNGDYCFMGRRDRLVKRRGYRIELGEIEAALYLHPRINQAAAVAVPDEEGATHIHAFIACGDGPRPSTIQLKAFCARNLPLYMVPDRFFVLAVLPQTSTEKTDYQRLKEFTQRQPDD